MTGFTILGVFVLLLTCATVIVLLFGAWNANDLLFSFKDGCIGGMIVLIILLLAYLSVTGVTFKQNPEVYGYTKIIEEETE